ncbi:MAG: MFS transporter [Clostridia bacterium]|nr:MFS transporter [Clostridia bacterium]
MNTSNFKIENKKTALLLAWLCSLTYLGSYLTRVNFGAVTVEIINSTGWEKSAISVVTTALFISYGAGQLVSGKLCDKYDSHKIASIGLLCSAIMNLCIPFCTSIPQMTVIWFVNGFAQSMMWPPIVKILATHCHTEDYQRASVIVSLGSTAGTMLVYLISPVCIELAGWKMVFYICAGTTILIWAMWTFCYPWLMSRAERSEAEQHPADVAQQSDAAVERMPRLLYFVLCPILLSAVVLGALRDSITTWLPSYISETFNMGESISVLSGVIIPILTAIIYPLSLKVYRKFFTNELTCAAAIFGLSALSAVLLYFTYSSSPIISVLLLAFICAAQHGINFLIIVLSPKRFSRFGNVGTISGLLNSFVYVGSAISIWGIAKIAESAGWRATIAVWGIAAAAGIALCLVVSRKWSQIFHKKK